MLDEIKGDKAYGKLTIKGVTKPVVLAYENGGTATDLYGNKRVGLGLSGKINRTDFGVSWNKALETGAVIVGEDVKLDITLEGILQK